MVLGVRRGRVHLVESVPAWASLFAVEAERLHAALAALPAVVEHCGSTSVEGLIAKPIIDILVGVPAPVDVSALRSALLPLAYEYVPRAGVPGHEVFGRGNPRTHLVHLVPLDGSAWRRMLAFRDALRASPALIAEYAALKRTLAARFSNDRSAYTEGKSAFVADVLAKVAP